MQHLSKQKPSQCLSGRKLIILVGTEYMGERWRRFAGAVAARPRLQLRVRYCERTNGLERPSTMSSCAIRAVGVALTQQAFPLQQWTSVIVRGILNRAEWLYNRSTTWRRWSFALLNGYVHATGLTEGHWCANDKLKG